MFIVKRASEMNNDKSLPYWANNPTAIKMLEAYKRLIIGKPIRTKKGARLSLSLVSMEADFHRSMLNKQRFPDLCRLVNEAKPSHNDASGPTVSKRLTTALEANRNLRVQLDQAKEQASIFRDQLVAVEREIISLRLKVSRLENVERTNITKIHNI
jgi:hypothetical protein